ncbi:MAG TPA: hypothetical protein VGM67_18595 [Gemmatimonadaceae bacterium]|jgi:hypothetical protein
MSDTLTAELRGATVTLPRLGLRGTKRVIVFAAVVLGATTASIAFLALRHRANDDAVVPVMNYSSFFRDERGLPMGLSLMPSPVGSRWAIAAEPRAVRLGARLADLEIVSFARMGATHASYYDESPVANWVVIRNSDLIEKFAGELAQGFDAVPEGRVTAAWYRLVQARGRDRATVEWTYMGHAREWALDFHPGLLVLGEWLELGRAAALRHDYSFFARPESRALLAGALLLPKLSPQTAVSLELVRDLTSRTTAGDFRALEHALTAALETLAK